MIRRSSPWHLLKVMVAFYGKIESCLSDILKIRSGNDRHGGDAAFHINIKEARYYEHIGENLARVSFKAASVY